jgi:large subunit ribosomal protein L28
VQEKRLFSYIHDRHIRVKVTTHALRCIDKAGGIDEYLLKTPYNKMETELGIIWKARLEKMYAQLGQMEVGLFSPEEESKIEKGFEEAESARKEATKEVRGEVREEVKQRGDGGRKGKFIVVG